MEIIDDINQINKIFQKVRGQIIEKFSVKTKGAEQYFRLLTDKSEIRFGANDLGVWIEEYNEKKL